MISLQGNKFLVIESKFTYGSALKNYFLKAISLFFAFRKTNNSCFFLFVFAFEQNNTGISGSSRSFSHSQRRHSAPVKIVAVNSNNGRAAGERNATVLMETTLKEMRDGASVIDVDSKATVGGGVRDVYGEDTATEDQHVTPWSVSVAR